MTQLLYIVASLIIGAGSGLQVALLGSIGRVRGASEAALINTMGAFMGIALLLCWQILRHNAPNLPSPFNSLAPFLIGIAAAVATLAVCTQGLDPYLAFTGFLGFSYVIGASFLAPRVGVALFASAVTVGTLTASVGLDHVGAFGGVVQRISVFRVVGLMFLALGVVMVRSGR